MTTEGRISERVSMQDTETDEFIEKIGKRARILDSLLAEPKDKRDLTDDLDISRSTINRGIRELEAVGAIEYVDGEFVPTVCGREAATKYRCFREQMETIQQLEPFLRWIPPDEFEVDLEHLSEASLHLPDPSDPYSMINHHVETLRETETIRAVLPFVGLHATEAVHERVVDHGARSEIIVQAETAETLLSGDYERFMREMSTTGRLDVYVTERPIPYYLGRLDDLVQIGVDQHSEPRAILDSTDATVRDWAAEKYQSFKRTAQPIEVADSNSPSALP